MTAQLIVGAAAGNKEITDLFVGTATGNKEITDLWIGTPTGNKLIFEATKGFDPALTSANVILGENNHLTTRFGGNGFPGSRSRTLRTTGKRYFEIQNIGAMANSDAGFCIVGVGLDAELSAAGVPAVALEAEGFLRIGGPVAVLFPGPVTDRLTGFALDLDARLCWVKPAGFDWNNSPTADPAAGVGGFNFASVAGAGVAVHAAVSMQDGAFRANFGRSAWQIGIPAGFSRWG